MKCTVAGDWFVMLSVMKCLCLGAAVDISNLFHVNPENFVNGEQTEGL